MSILAGERPFDVIRGPSLRYEAPIRRLITLVQDQSAYGGLVGPSGVEPLTSALSAQRSSQLSYGPSYLRASCS